MDADELQGEAKAAVSAQPTVRDVRADSAVASSSRDERPLSHYEFVFDGLTAVATIVVAILALFGERIRNWISRPKIQITLDGNSTPFVGEVETVPATAASGLQDVCQRKIRICIKNQGRMPAKGFSLQIDRVYLQKDGGNDFYKESLVPRAIPIQEITIEDPRARLDLIPNYPLYVDIAEIRMPEVLAQNASAAQGQSPLPEVFIRIPHGARGEFFRAGRRKVFFRIFFYSESLRTTERRYVEIFWTGTDVAHLNPSNFSVRILHEIDAVALIGEL